MLPTAWRFVQPLLSSSYHGWGTSSLNNDVEEIEDCIKYILALRPKGKIVLMGHSTGCQDIMHYLLSPMKDDKLPRPHLAGGIMQAGCSDREAFGLLMSKDVYDASVHVAQLYVSEGRGEDVLPAHALGGSFPGVPICARRWLSLTSPPPAHDGEDDYFSSDFGEDRLRRTFGRIGTTGTPIQMLYSEKDQYVPETVDKIRLLERWARAIKEGGGTVDQDSGIIKGADHTLDASEGTVADMVRRVIGFLDRVEKGL